MSIATELEALNTNIKNAYNAIDTKGGTIPQNKNMVNLPTAIDSISGGGGDNNWAEFMRGETTEIYDNAITFIPSYFLTSGYLTSRLANITKLSFPSVISIDTYGLYANTKVTTIETPSLESFNGKTYMLAECNALVEFVAKNAGGIIAMRTFDNDQSIKKIDVGDIERINAYAMQGCRLLEALVIRKKTNSVPNLISTAFNSSGISRGIGYIYVPSNMVASFKSEGNWSTYANQIRAIEDYSTDGTINGDIIV